MQAGWAEGNDRRPWATMRWGGTAEDLVLPTFPSLDYSVEMHGLGHLGVFPDHDSHPVNYQRCKSLDLFGVLNCQPVYRLQVVA